MLRDRTEQKMNFGADRASEAVLVELVKGAAAVKRYVERAEAHGNSASCARCDDAMAPIGGILIAPGPHDRVEWPLCASCLIDFPERETLYYNMLDD